MRSVLTSLEELWKKGRLRDLEQDLDLFIRNNLPEIRRLMRDGREAGQEVARRRYLRGEITDRQRVDFCMRMMLRKRGTCNARRDIEEQRDEIEKEVWYEGERGSRPVAAARREEIARSWASQHASQWREWRLFQILYVWEKKADQYADLFTSSANP